MYLYIDSKCKQNYGANLTSIEGRKITPKLQNVIKK